MAVSCPNCGHENGDGAKFCSDCGASLAVSATHGRKVVTILFSDVTGSTSLGEHLDPESLRGVMGRFYDIGRAAVARHGGVVEKFIGDALMAVFGVPHVHEDDALRAVRAALELRAQLDALNDELEAAYGIRLATRTGINTGEVAVGAGEVFASGDAVNVAARLEQWAEPGAILLAETTRELVRGAVDVEPAGPLDLKGKAEPVRAWRLLALVGDAPFERQLDAPLVGRDRELGTLREQYDHAVADRACRLVTVLGPAGIGKSRLVRELEASAADAHTLSGSCVPYGEGITYWPIAAVVRAAAGLDDELSADEALRRVQALLASDPDAELVAERVAVAIGLVGGGAPAVEIFWAVRRLLESLARERPLIVVLDDIHWAEPTLLDLIEHLADRIEDVPVLLVCLARDELLELRPSWSQGTRNAVTVQLEALGPQEVAELIAELHGDAVDEGLRERIARAADGNPLFVEEMLEILPEDGGAAASVPPTIQALLAARLDGLGGDERAIVGAASVVGQEFSRMEVGALEQQPGLDQTMDALVRRRFFRSAEIRSEAGWLRFWHLLSRDAAYAALPKTLRSELHERFARFLEQEAGERVQEVEELVAHHLEQAYEQWVAVALPDERALRLAGEAAGRLAGAGARASGRGDLPAAANLLERSLALLPPDARERPDVQMFLGATLLEQGRTEDAETQLAEAEAGAEAWDLRAVELSAQVTRMMIRLYRDPVGFDFDGAIPAAEAAIAELERLDAWTAIAGVWRVLYIMHLFRADTERAELAAERALDAARRAGYVRGEAEGVFFLALARLVGPMPASEALHDCEQRLAESTGPLTTASLLTVMGGFQGMLGNIEEARRLVRDGREGLRDLGFLVYSENMALTEAFVEFHAGDLVAAEQTLEDSTRALESIGEIAASSMHLAVRALFVARLGRFDEALELSRLSEQSAIAAFAHGSLRSARALALAGLGRHDEAVAVAREAAALMRRTSDMHGTAMALQSLAEVLAASGELDEAEVALEDARALFEQKSCVVCLAGAHLPTERAARTAARVTDLPGR
jgi:class 3 adenylate cyclase